MKPIRMLGAGFALAAFLCTGCGSAPSTEPGANAEIMLGAAVDGSQVDVIVIQVTGADIPTPILYNLKVVNGFASGNLKVPAGTARSFDAAAYDPAGAVIAEGRAVIDVVQGANPPTTIALVPKAGRVPITIQVGPVSVQISPGTATAAVGSAIQFTATVRASGGQVVQVAVDWATALPHVASVDATGRATCASAGTTAVQAVAEGVPGVASITCTAPPPAAQEEGT